MASSNHKEISTCNF